MRENLFKLGQRVKQKNMSNECSFIINNILYNSHHGKVLYAKDQIDADYYEESELELVKEKRKVKLFAPIIQHGNVYYTDHHYHSNKSIFSTQLNVVGFHEIEVEIDE